MAFLEPENPASLSAVNSSLRQSLERELVHVEGGRPASMTKKIYDAVYLPRLIALSEQAKRHASPEDWQLLCQPLQLDLAKTQIQMVVEILRSLRFKF